jgi:bifunctional non-homologous end joining protein LigD
MMPLLRNSSPTNAPLPVLVAQVEFTEWTPDGHLRHSSFAGLRDDKEARQIVRE